MNKQMTRKNCGMEFDSDNTAENNQRNYHPEEAVHVGNSGPQGNYDEIWKFPCCDQIVLRDPQPARSPGCTQGVYIVDTEKTMANMPL